MIFNTPSFFCVSVVDRFKELFRAKAEDFSHEISELKPKADQHNIYSEIERDLRTY